MPTGTSSTRTTTCAARCSPTRATPSTRSCRVVRYARAAELLAGAPTGSITMDVLHGFLADHEHAPDSLCRHEAEGRTSVTAFWCVADVTAGAIRFGRGNPCDSETQEYRFASYGGA